MPPKRRQIVYVDTNVIFEAIETGCWAALLNRFDVRTVTEVKREAKVGDSRMRGYVEVDAAQFDEKVTVNKVSKVAIADAQLRSSLMSKIDPGVRDLLAYVAAQNESAWLISTADRAAVRAACDLGLSDSLRSLEELAQSCGQKPKVNEWHTKKWLSGVKTEYLMDSI